MISGIGNGVMEYCSQNAMYLWVPDFYALLVFCERPAFCRLCICVIRASSAMQGTYNVSAPGESILKCCTCWWDGASAIGLLIPSKCCIEILK